MGFLVREILEMELKPGVPVPVTESKLVPLATQQIIRSSDNVLGQGKRLYSESQRARMEGWGPEEPTLLTSHSGKVPGGTGEFQLETAGQQG